VTLVPLYQSEIAPPRIRGLLVGMHGTMIGTGYAMACYVGLGFYFVNASGAQWRIPLAIQCLPPLLLACGVMMLPETPRWRRHFPLSYYSIVSNRTPVIMKNRVEDALMAFKATRSESSDELLTDEEGLRADFEHLRRQTMHELEHVVPFKRFLVQKSLRKRCIIGFLTMFGAQCTATIVINSKYYAAINMSNRFLTLGTDFDPLLYGNLGFNTVQQLGIQCGWVSTAPFGNLINAMIVDRVGRVRLLCEPFIIHQVARVLTHVSDRFHRLYAGTGGRMYHCRGVPKDWRPRCCFRSCILPFRPHHGVCTLCRRYHLYICGRDLPNTTPSEGSCYLMLWTLLCYNNFYNCSSDRVCEDWLEVLPGLCNPDNNHDHHCVFLVPRGMVAPLALFITS